MTTEAIRKQHERIKTECLECSSNNTQIIGNTLRCHDCRADFVNSNGAKND